MKVSASLTLLALFGTSALAREDKKVRSSLDNYVLDE